MPKRVTERGLFWTGVWCVLGAALVTVAGPLFLSNQASIVGGGLGLQVVSFIFSYVVVVARDFGIIAIVAALALRVLDGRPTDGAVTTIESLADRA